MVCGGQPFEDQAGQGWYRIMISVILCRSGYVGRPPHTLVCVRGEVNLITMGGVDYLPPMDAPSRWPICTSRVPVPDCVRMTVSLEVAYGGDQTDAVLTQSLLVLPSYL
jgi:hypothetical protein